MCVVMIVTDRSEFLADKPEAVVASTKNWYTKMNDNGPDVMIVDRTIEQKTLDLICRYASADRLDIC